MIYSDTVRAAEARERKRHLFRLLLAIPSLLLLCGRARDELQRLWVIAPVLKIFVGLGFVILCACTREREEEILSLLSSKTDLCIAAREVDAPVCREYSEMKPLKVSSVSSLTSR